jgi:hypothetical protein
MGITADEIKRDLAAVAVLLPNDEAELLIFTTPGLLNDDVRNNVFEARSRLDDLLARLRRANNPFAPRIWDIADLFQHDRLHFEAIIAHPDGQRVMRDNVNAARAKLESIVKEIR